MGSANQPLAARASGSWSQVFSIAGATVTPLAIAVDGADHAFVLACVGDCDAGARLLSRIDADGSVAFEARIENAEAALRLNLLAISADDRIGLAGDRVDPDGTTRLLAEVFDASGRLLFARTDAEGVLAAEVTFDGAGKLVVVGSGAAGGGLAVAFADATGGGGWRQTVPNASFLRVRSDATGGSSIAGVSTATGQAAVWRVGAGGALRWSFAAAPVSADVAVAVDGAGDTALVSRGPLESAGEEGQVNALLTTCLNGDGSVRWAAQSAGNGNGDRPLAAAFDEAQDVTVFGRHQFPARFGGGFETIRYDPSGAAVWATVDDFGQADAEPTALALDGAVGVAVTGNVQSPPGAASGFVALYGAAAGATLFSTPDPTTVVGVATDSAGGILVLGASGSNAVVTRYVVATGGSGDAGSGAGVVLSGLREAPGELAARSRLRAFPL